MATRATRILKYQSAQAHYAAEVCIIWCFDHRFKKVLEELYKQRKYRHPDEVKGAGGAKPFTASGSKSARKYILEQIENSHKLHHTPRVIIMTHSDCGGYGGLKAFGNDSGAERREHFKDLRSAKAFLRKKLPRPIKIEAVFADFSGLWRI